MANIVLCIILMLLFGGCATVVTDSQQVTNKTKAVFDPYSQTNSVVGMELKLGGFPNITTAWMQSSFNKAGDNEKICLFVYHWSQTGWLFLNNASDISGTVLAVRVVSREVRANASVEETITIDLPRAFIEGRKNQGLNIRVSGTQGFLIVNVPGVYIQGFLEKHDATTKKLKQKSTS